jgi:predicted transcriptional regulator
MAMTMPKTSARLERMVNTIQVVLDHAPIEIAELEADIHTMQERLREASARKQVLVQLVAVAQVQWQNQPTGVLTLVREDEAIEEVRAAAK